jgi:hypothetical protein
MACEDLRQMISEITKLQIKRDTGFRSVLNMAEIKKQSSVQKKKQSKCCGRSLKHLFVEKPTLNVVCLKEMY